MIFIGGTGRCGTTVLLDAFAKHSNVCPFWEPKFIEATKGIKGLILDMVDWNTFRYNMIKDLYKFSSDYESQPYKRPDVYNQSNIIKLFRTVETNTKDGDDIGDMALSFIKGFFSLGNKDDKMIVEKTPNNIIMASMLDSMFPGSTIIHIIRDPIDCCASTIKQPWGPDSVNSFVSKYNYIMDKAWKQYEKVKDSRYVCVKFEDLIKDTKNTMKKLFTGTHLRFQNECLSAFNLSKANVGKGAEDFSSLTIKYIEDNCKIDKWENLFI